MKGIRIRAVVQCQWCGKEHDYLASSDSFAYGHVELPSGWKRTNPLIQEQQILCPNCHDRFCSGATP